jgi:phosphatidylglycerophosphatase A
MAPDTLKDMSWRNRVAAVLSTAFGLGYAPFAPGTAGTLLGVLIHVLIATLSPARWQLATTAAAFVVVCAASVPLARWAERFWGETDPGRFVLDEVAGYLLAVLLFKSGDLLLSALWAFAFFRLFDIVKPPPAKRLESLPRGWGVLVDDLVAGAYAAGALHVMAALAPSLLGATLH